MKSTLSRMGLIVSRIEIKSQFNLMHLVLDNMKHKVANNISEHAKVEFKDDMDLYYKKTMKGRSVNAEVSGSVELVDNIESQKLEDKIKKYLNGYKDLKTLQERALNGNV